MSPLQAQAREACGSSSLDELVAVAKAALDELRERGRPLRLEGDAAHHSDGLRCVESLASSARIAAQIAAADAANDNAR